MKAITYTRYGSPDVLQLEEVETPTPSANEVLVKICAASVNAYDWRYVRANPFLVRLVGGLFRPRNPRLGADIAGWVEAVGSAVTQFRPGDQVYGDLAASGNGAFAEYIAVPEHAVALKPANLTYEQAAAVPMAAVTALQALRDGGKIRAGHQVLINGASGGVGTFAVQIAKAFGAEVTAVCSTRNVALVRTLGADHIIDYTREDITRRAQRYDLILAVNGYHPLVAYRRMLRPEGRYVMTGGSGAQLFETLLFGPLMSLVGRKRLAAFTARPSSKDLLVMKELLEAGKVVPVVDRCYPLDETAEAIRYLEGEHARGKVVITVMQGSQANMVGV
jgi:NADPH:quinone reductase-like Zn-dependent oxidoreductase